MDFEQLNTLTKALVRQSTLFQGFTEAELDVLVMHSQLKKLPRGKILYRKGEASDGTFCLMIAGSVDIVAKDGHVVGQSSAGDVIGELALSNPYQMRTVSVITTEPVELLEWNINHIKTKVPGLWKKLLKLGWEHMQEYYEE